MEAGVVGNDGGLPVHFMGVSGEKCHIAFIGVVDHFLGSAPFGYSSFSATSLLW